MGIQDSNSNSNNETFLIHSLVGNTSGNNSTETLINILNQTTIKPSSQSTNQAKEGSE